MGTVGSLKATAIAAVALLAIGLVRLPSLELGTELHERFLPSDPALAAMATESKLFGATESAFVLVEDIAREDWPELEAALPGWQRELESLAGVVGTQTYLDVPIAAASAGGWTVTRLGDRDGAHQAALARGLAGLGGFRRDAGGVAIALAVEPSATDRISTADAIGRWAQRTSSRWPFRVVGGVILERSVARTALRDAARLTALAGLAILGLLSIAFGMSSALCVVLPAFLSVGAAVGLADLAGVPLSALALAAAPTIAAIAVLDNVHIATAFSGSMRDDARGRARVFSACFWTTATTIAGLLVLAMNDVPQVSQFGTLAAVGTGLAFVVSVGLLPPLLERFGSAKPPRSAGGGAGALAPVLRSRILAPTALLLLLVSLPGAAAVSIRPEYPRIFPDDHPVTRELEALEANWGGLATVSFLLEPKPGVEVFDRQVVERAGNFASLLRARPGVTGVEGPFAFIAQAAAAKRRTDRRDPTPSEYRDLFALAEDSPASSFYAERDGRPIYRVRARIRMMNPEAFPELAADLQGLALGLQEFFDVEVAGWPLVYKNLESALLEEFFASFAAATLVVALALFAVSRNIRVWLAAVFANAVPVAACLSALAWSDSGLGTGLLLVPGLAMGLIVDDTVHVVSAWRHRERGEESWQHELAEAAVPIAISTMVLIVTFALLTTSQFSMNQAMGQVMIFICAAALLCDVFLLGNVLHLYARREGSDALASARRTR